MVLEATIDKKGRVEAARIIDGHELLRPAALAAVKQWEFEPFYINGEAHAAAFTVTVKFKLDRSKDTQK